MALYLILVTVALATCNVVQVACTERIRPTEFDVASHIWDMKPPDNSSFNMLEVEGCSYCGEIFFNEPPPDDILYFPPPPIHPGHQSSLLDSIKSNQRKNEEDQCNYCNFFDTNTQLTITNGLTNNLNHSIIALTVGFMTISLVLFIYIIGVRRTKLIAALAQARFLKPNLQPNMHQHNGKNGILPPETMSSGARLADPYYLQTNRDKNLTSPIINDQATHKKTSIPSKYWAQPGSIIGRTVRRIPNEYEVPSSQTNSTGASSALYADMNNEGNQRFFSPYNLHTYAEVREVLDPSEHFHTSSNSSAMLSESNYDNAIHNHNSGFRIAAPNGSVQMSDLNSMRTMQSMNYGQHIPMNQNHSNVLHLNQPIYEQPPQRAQVIITSSNQGVNPTLLNYKEKIHNVI